MLRLKFEYLPDPIFNHKTQQPDIIYRPKLTLRLFYGRLSKFNTVCLLDSGADRNLFPAYWGELIGIPIKSGELHTAEGIGKSIIKTYRHKVKLYLEDFYIDSVVHFSYEQQEPLLGRLGFFDQFNKVIFNEKKKYFEIEKFK